MQRWIAAGKRQEPASHGGEWWVRAAAWALAGLAAGTVMAAPANDPELKPELQALDRRLDEHFGYEARDDVAGVLATLAPDVEHDIVGWPAGPAHGREAARPFYENLFADLSDGSVKSLRRLYGENFLVDESLWRGRASGRPFGIEGRGRPRRT